MEHPHIGAELKMLSNMIGRYLDSYLIKQNCFDITGNNGRIIIFLAKNSDRDIFQKDIEEQFSVTRSTVSKVLNLMEQKGLIQRQSVPYDARLKKIVLTEKSLKISKKMKENAVFMEENLISGFSPEELANLRDYIQRMKSNVTKI